MSIPGFTSTGSKRPDVMFGSNRDVPLRMQRADGCRIWDAAGTEYTDMGMALGAVALGYAHPSVVSAVNGAMRDGAVGTLPPLAEEEVALALTGVIPGAEAVQFFKTGAEAVAAAVRIARVETARDRVITCGYHGWLDWCQDSNGVPQSIRELRREVAFNDGHALRETLDAFDPVAAIVIEPIVDKPPTDEWLRIVREEASRRGAVLIFDEIKTAFRVAVGGVAGQRGILPDLAVVGKALGNGLPVAAVCGPRALMEAATRTWISSTLATEYVSLAAARAVLETFDREPVEEHLERVGKVLFGRLQELSTQYPEIVSTVRGVPQMCYLEFTTDQIGGVVAREAARRGLLFKRTAYNFVSLAHSEEIIVSVCERLGEALEAGVQQC